MFAKAIQKELMQKHSAHKAVCDRKRADTTMAVNVCTLYLQTANRQRQMA